jgi:hypothetical protein
MATLEERLTVSGVLVSLLLWPVSLALALSWLAMPDDDRLTRCELTAPRMKTPPAPAAA